MVSREGGDQDQVGVSILAIDDLPDIFVRNTQEHCKPIAYLCLGYVNKFEDKPDLERVGWLKRAILSKVIHYENWNTQNRIVGIIQTIS